MIVKEIEVNGIDYIATESASSDCEGCELAEYCNAESIHETCLSHVIYKRKKDESAPVDDFKPGYYQDNNGRDLISAFIESQGLLAFEAAALFNIEKYLTRAGKKPGEDKLKDYKKAAEYLRRMIVELEPNKDGTED